MSAGESAARAAHGDPSTSTTVTYAADPDTSRLTRLREIALDMAHYRHLLYQLTVRDIKIKYKQAVMGFGWAVFMPILIVLSGIIVRFAMAYLGGGELEKEVIAGLALKAIPWSFFVGSIQFSSGVLIGNMSLVTKIYFPREVLPVAAILAQTFDTVIGTTAFAILLPFLGVQLSWHTLWVFPLALLLFMITVGAGLFLSCANLFFRDVKYIVRTILTFGIFFTPVFFEPEMFGQLGAQVMMLNPLAPILEGIRLSVAEGHNLLEPLTVTVDGESILAWTPWYLLYATVASLGTLVGSALMFHRLEFLFAEYI